MLPLCYTHFLTPLPFVSLPCSYVHKLAPRGIYTSGKGSSAVGLTAYVTKVCMPLCPTCTDGTALAVHWLSRRLL